MSTTNQNNRDFIADLISSSLLDDAIDWIANSLSPEEVFRNEELKTWAEDNGYVLEEDSR